MKECKKCGESKPLSAFHKHPRTRDGLETSCKECRHHAAAVRKMDRHRGDPEYREDFNRKRRERYTLLNYGVLDPTPLQRLEAGDRFAKARALGYRSGLEAKIARELDAKGISYGYETLKIPFTPPLKERTYTPDVILPNGIIVELKGRFLTEDRQKHKHIKDQHPLLDVRFVFSSARTRLSKNSPTTYAMWAEKYGFPWADKAIPDEWLDEPEDAGRIEYLLSVMRPLKTKK